jgi:phosphocarrier protein FPr
MPIISEDLIALGVTVASKEEAVRLAGDLLVRAGRVLPAYVDSMLQKEQSESVTYIGAGVAIPHCMDADRVHVLQNGVSLVQLARGVAWYEGEEANLVFGIAGKDGDEHLQVMAALTEAVSDEDSLATLLSTKDPRVILGILNGTSEVLAAPPAPAEPEPATEATLRLELVVQNQTGLHARPATVLVGLAKQFQADLRILCHQKRANAKSMTSVLTLGAGFGAAITLEARGTDAEQALAALGQAIRTGLGEAVGAPAADAPAAAERPRPVQVVEPQGPGNGPGSALGSGLIRGIGAAPGIAVGPVFHYRTVDVLSYDNLDGGGQMAFAEALAQARTQLRTLHRQMCERRLDAEAAIFEAHAEFLEDEELIEQVEAGMKAGQTAARAWKTTVEIQAEAIASCADPLLAARADDLRDVGRRVLRLVLGIPEKGLSLPETPVVIVARDLSPSDTAAFDPERVRGFVIVEGGPTAHIAILARALGLPAIVSAGERILALEEATPVILDGNDGTLSVNPAPDRFRAAAEAQAAWLERRRVAQEQAALPAATVDGHHVDVTGNAGSHQNAIDAMKMSAQGIGLLRTEFLFLDRATAPSEDEQYAVYRAIAETMRGLPVIVRTLDIGGDKPVAYIRQKAEANPFLGERGVRLCLSHPDLFRKQLRGILRAARYGQLQIMFPMIAELGELRQAKAILEQERAALNVPPVRTGIMIEVPSAALLADKLAPEVDFFSIGTNDLTQYTLAMDRGNAGLAARQDGLHPAVLRLISLTAEAAHRHGKRVDLCGELGSDALAIPILVGLGVDELSVSIPAIPTVKAQIRTIQLSSAQQLARQALECASAADVRELARGFTAH